MPRFEVEFEVYCSCGRGLCSQSNGSNDRYRRARVTVEPCEKCMEQADGEGYDRGLKEGLSDH